MKPAAHPKSRESAPLAKTLIEQCLALLAKKESDKVRKLLAPVTRGYIERGETLPQELEELLALCMATDLLKD
jgi:hypothetical protein